MHTELEPLDEAMKGAGEKMKDFKGPNKVRPLKVSDFNRNYLRIYIGKKLNPISCSNLKKKSKISN